MSDSPVLAAAKAAPSCAGLYPRERLFPRLDALAPASALWLCGPAGAGKSSLLASFLAGRQRRSLWCRVEEGDVDLSHFFHGLTAACIAALDLEADALPVFTDADRGDPSAFADRFFREAFRLAGPAFALVFDDLDRVPSEALSAVVCRCIEAMPAGNQCYVTSRTAPGAGYARLASNGKLMTLAWNELDTRPSLDLWQALCSAGNDEKAARASLEHAFAEFKQAGDTEGALTTWCAMTDLSISPIRGLEHLRLYVGWLEAYLPELPEDLPAELKVRTASTMRRALWHCRPGDPGNDRWGEIADQHLAAIASPDMRVQIAEARLSEHVTWTGNHAGAESVYLTVAKLIGEKGLGPLTQVRLAIARHAFHWSRADAGAGLEAVSDGMRIVDAAQLDSHRSLLSLLAFRYCMLLGRLDEARRHVETMAAGQDGGTIEDRLRHHVCAAWLGLEAGDAASANSHALEALRISDTAEVPCAHVLALITLAQTRFALGNRVEAATLINWALGLAQKLGSVCWQFNCLVFKAYIALASGGATPSREAVGALKAAFAVGRERGFVFFNFCRSGVLQALCSAALEHGVEPDYARRLIVAHRLQPGEDAPESWPWPVMVYTLRPFAMYCGGKLVKFPAKAQAKPVALLKALVALGGDRVSEAMLTEILWPDAEGDRAHWVFRVTLRRLRQLLGGSADGEQVIELSDGQVSLNRTMVWTDVRGFAAAREVLDAALRDAASSRGTAPADAAIAEALDRVLALYRGHFLEQESAHEEVFLPCREKLRSHFRRAVRDAARHWETRGDWVHAADCYQKGLEIDPVAEELYCGLMHAYTQQGLAAEAVRTYQRCVHALQTLLNIKPGRRLQEMLSAIHAQRHGEFALAAGS